MRIEALRDICEVNPRFSNGQNPDEQCSFVPMEFVDDTFAEIARTETRQVAEVQRGYTPFKNGDVILAKITPCMENGKCAIARNLVNGIGFGSTEFHVMRAGELVIPEWIYYFVRQESVRKKLERKMRGSAGQKRVPNDAVEELLLPIPLLSEQRRIAALLDRSDHLRRTRRYAAQLSDTFLQTVFVRMFGEPVRNPMRWDENELGDVAAKQKFAIVDGPFGSHLKAEEYSNIGVRVIRVNNIKPNAFNFTDVRYVSVEKYETIKRSTVRPNDIIMAKVGNTIGKTCVFPSSLDYAVLTANVCKITVDPDCTNASFISRQMNFDGIQERIRNLAGDTAKPMINIPRLSELKLVVPPLALQQKFAHIAQQFEHLRSQQREAERQAEHLFQTLLHKAFA